MTFRELLQAPSLLPYMMAGLPDAAGSVSIFQAMAEAGADGFEIGIPYSDPLMDGPVIQEAGRRSLEAGTTLADGLGVVERVAELTGLPCAVMTYVNPVLRAGAASFARVAADAGASALIVADLPVDESPEIAAAGAEAGVGLVQFIAPTTTDERLDLVAEMGPPFVYGVAEMGVTGERSEASALAPRLVARWRPRSAIPLVLGVGISSAQAAAQAAAIADGVIVGSAVVRRVLEAATITEAAASVAAVVGEMSDAVHGAPTGGGRSRS